MPCHCQALRGEEKVKQIQLLLGDGNVNSCQNFCKDVESGGFLSLQSDECQLAFFFPSSNFACLNSISEKQVGVGQLILPDAWTGSMVAWGHPPAKRGCSHGTKIVKLTVPVREIKDRLFHATRLRLNKIAILVNEPLVAQGHDHRLTRHDRHDMTRHDPQAGDITAFRCCRASPSLIASESCLTFIFGTSKFFGACSNTKFLDS